MCLTRERCEGCGVTGAFKRLGVNASVAGWSLRANSLGVRSQTIVRQAPLLAHERRRRLARVQHRNASTAPLASKQFFRKWTRDASQPGLGAPPRDESSYRSCVVCVLRTKKGISALVFNQFV